MKLLSPSLLMGLLSAANSDLRSTNWTSLGGPQTATSPTLSATDYAPNGPARFYRAVRVPAGH